MRLCCAPSHPLPSLIAPFHFCLHWFKPHTHPSTRMLGYTTQPLMHISSVFNHILFVPSPSHSPATVKYHICTWSKEWKITDQLQCSVSIKCGHPRVYIPQNDLHITTQKGDVVGKLAINRIRRRKRRKSWYNYMDSIDKQHSRNNQEDSYQKRKWVILHKERWICHGLPVPLWGNRGERKQHI